MFLIKPTAKQRSIGQTSVVNLKQNK